jgi:hypothetical protein
MENPDFIDTFCHPINPVAAAHTLTAQNRLQEMLMGGYF